MSNITMKHWIKELVLTVSIKYSHSKIWSQTKTTNRSVKLKNKKTEIVKFKTVTELFMNDSSTR